MARRKKGTPLHGWINLDKPVGVTSTQALGIVKRALKPQKAGHGGTLDPLASGILPICLGEATKTVNYAMDALKTYRFTITWGEERSTDDMEGDVLASSDTRPALKDIENIIPLFIGDIEQLPPQFSAVKINGERAYDIARDGEYADIKPRHVYIEELELIESTQDTATFECLCGKGTYVRAIARDMGQKLGCYGYISKLERLSVGPFTLENAISLDIFRQMVDNNAEVDTLRVLLPLQTVLDDIPVLALKDDEVTRLKNGNPISLVAKPDFDRLKETGCDTKNGDTLLVSYNGQPLALCDVKGPIIKPVRVFNF
jgi:tRNA pseudouridine55 synthase